MSWIESCESHLYTFTCVARGFLYFDRTSISLVGRIASKVQT